MSDSNDSLPPGMIISGRYRVERELGSGGMGSVLLVRHVNTDEKLALKVLHSAVISDTVALERFRREARTPARIDSDHVVRVTDADVSEELDGAPFLVMEYLRGEDLEHHIERVGKMAPADVVRTLRQAARALDKAHAIGIVHRDLKPENLFLCTREDGTPLIKILDFGIAKFTSAAGETDMVKTSQTSPGAIFGTPLFMSPEQAKGESTKVSPQTDVWALGLIAHKLLSGEDLWTAETLAHLIAQIAYEPIPVPSEQGFDLGPGYDNWLKKCCEREPEDRFPSAGEAVDALARALGVPAAQAVSLVDGTGPITVVSAVSTGPSYGRTPEAFSKTDHALSTGSGTNEGGKAPVVVLGLVLALAAGVLLWLQPWAETTTAAGPTKADPSVELIENKPTVEPMPSAAPVASASAAPSASAVASAAPKETSTPIVTPTVKPPPPVAPPPPPPPPPPEDPLAGRH